jgi:CRISPR-associated protein Cas2
MAAADKRWRVVCYDVRHPKRYRRVYKIVSGSGRRLQYSVFRCWLDDREVEKLRWRLANVMDGPTSAALSTLWRTIGRLGLTVKKNRHVALRHPRRPESSSV